MLIEVLYAEIFRTMKAYGTSASFDEVLALIQKHREEHLQILESIKAKELLLRNKREVI
jgi:hypothetical protein